MRARLRKLWRDHSLTIVRLSMGAAGILAALPLPEGKWWDLVAGLGLTFFAVALNDAMAGRWREVNRPEE